MSDNSPGSHPVPAKGLLQRWSSDTGGASAIEFAMTAMPFLLFIFGIMITGLQFFTMNSLEHGVESAGRLVRTGQAQNSNMTVAQFKQSICQSASAPLACDSHLSVHIQQGAQWSDIVPQPCLKNDGTLNTGTGTGTDSLSTYSGSASVVVLVTACYQWDLPKNVPIIPIGNMSNGARLLQAATTFRSEPFN